MTVVPALSSRALDGPANADAKQSEILATLKQILAELRALLLRAHCSVVPCKVFRSLRPVNAPLPTL